MSGSKRPNFLVILADDLGYSDIGCFGSEIKTPYLDELARQGLRMTDFHTAAVCSPTRSMLLSGTDCHLAGMGIMSEFRTVDPDRWNKPGHEGYLNDDVATMPEVLRDAGYLTLMAGKWHLGWKEGYLPHNRGFEKSFVMVPGSTNHWGWEPNWEAEDAAQGGRPQKFIFGHSLPLYMKDGVKWKPDPNLKNDAKTGFYSSTYYTDTLVDMLTSRNEEEKSKPFLGYLAFTAPHFPLQAPKEDIDLYRGKYDDGPDALRLRRLENLKKMGLIGKDVVPHAVEAETAEWNDMSAKEKKMSSRAMECFAGMVTVMDREIGKIVEHLRETGQLDNTVVIFHSDNGAEGAAMEANPAMGPSLLKAIDRYYDNSYENLGNHNSFCWYGPRWAQASTAPSRLMKAYNTEGGIRVPFIVRYPPFMQQHQPGTVLPTFATCMDVMPTLLDLAKATHPNSGVTNPRHKVAYKGHEVYPMMGKSWLPFLIEGKSADPSSTSVTPASIHGPNDPPTGWEMFGRAGLRKGMWKIDHMNADDHGKGKWELYDLSVDPGEVNDLADERPEKLKELVADFDTYVKHTGTIWGSPVDIFRPRSALPKDMIGGDPIQDQRAWMYVGVGQRFNEAKAAA